MGHSNLHGEMWFSEDFGLETWDEAESFKLRISMALSIKWLEPERPVT